MPTRKHYSIEYRLIGFNQNKALPVFCLQVALSSWPASLEHKHPGNALR